jgi:hypothetical protein
MQTKHTQNLIAVALVGGLAAMALLGAVAPAQGVESPPTRSIRITTNEVTDPDVAVSSDGRLLVFTALGHLFQLSTTGGSAKQLTFGPYYDSAPAISPDGTSVAFISDRETLSQGNVFVLDIASGRMRRLTNEFWADRPAWSPDGKSIAFLSYELLGPTGDYWFVVPNGLRSETVSKPLLKSLLCFRQPLACPGTLPRPLSGDAACTTTLRPSTALPGNRVTCCNTRRDSADMALT